MSTTSFAPKAVFPNDNLQNLKFPKVQNNKPFEIPQNHRKSFHLPLVYGFSFLFVSPKCDATRRSVCS